MKKNLWTDAEIAQIREMYGVQGMSAKQCARRMPGRTPGAIASRARKNGIKSAIAGKYGSNTAVTICGPTPLYDVARSKAARQGLTMSRYITNLIKQDIGGSSGCENH